MKIMPVVLEENVDIEYKNKDMIYQLFSKICQENNVIFMTRIEKENLDGFLVFEKKKSDIVRCIVQKVNEILSECNIDYMVSLPVITDGVRFKKPTFYPDGKIKIIR